MHILKLSAALTLSILTAACQPEETIPVRPDVLSQIAATSVDLGVQLGRAHANLLHICRMKGAPTCPEAEAVQRRIDCIEADPMNAERCIPEAARDGLSDTDTGAR